MGKYAQSPEWADIVPLPQHEGPTPVISIAYSDDCTF
jgi:hypothetical protein